MPLTDLINRLNQAKREIESELPKKILQAGNNLTVKVSSRVINKGVDYKGDAFKGYSTKPILVSGNTAKSQAVGNRFWGKKETKWRTILSGGKYVHLFILEGGYKELRQLEGLQVAHKDFKFTNEMWTGFGVKRYDNTSVTLGGINQDAQDKIDGNSKREGRSIIKPSEKEIEIEKQRIITWINDKIYSG